MREIKATASTRKELYQDYKRVREENERLRDIAKIAFTKARMSSEREKAWIDLMRLENKTND